MAEYTVKSKLVDRQNSDNDVDKNIEDDIRTESNERDNLDGA